MSNTPKYDPNVQAFYDSALTTTYVPDLFWSICSACNTVAMGTAPSWDYAKPLEGTRATPAFPHKENCPR